MGWCQCLLVAEFWPLLHRFAQTFPSPGPNRWRSRPVPSPKSAGFPWPPELPGVPVEMALTTKEHIGFRAKRWIRDTTVRCKNHLSCHPPGLRLDLKTADAVSSKFPYHFRDERCLSYMAPWVFSCFKWLIWVKTGSWGTPALSKVWYPPLQCDFWSAFPIPSLLILNRLSPLQSLRSDWQRLVNRLYQCLRQVGWYQSTTGDTKHKDATTCFGVCLHRTLDL